LGPPLLAKAQQAKVSAGIHLLGLMASQLTPQQAVVAVVFLTDLALPAVLAAALVAAAVVKQAARAHQGRAIMAALSLVLLRAAVVVQVQLVGQV
jgi:hypothetical protein